MSEQPYFSIILPIKGHPLLLSDALTSLLQQECGDLEVLLSNNGADPTVKPAIAHLLGDPRIRYMEQPEVLDMPTHFELVSKVARGRYLILHTHRSVLKRHALAEVKKAHENFGDLGSVVTWSWDLYYENDNLLVANKNCDATTAVLDSDKTMLGSLADDIKSSYALPRALNSSVSMKVVEAMRSRFGEAFGKINPDFNFAYRCLLLRKEIVHINRPLMTSQGFSISNGGAALRGNTWDYLNTLGLKDAFVYAPVKAALVENTIVEDFLKNASVYGRTDLIAEWDRSFYYLKCLAEVAEKRAARIVKSGDVSLLEADVLAALSRESRDVQAKVAAAQLRTASPLTVMRRGVRRMLGEGIVAAIRPFFLRLRGATSHASVLQASGFGSER